MVLLVAKRGPLRKAIRHLFRKNGLNVATVTPAHSDLFGRALEQRVMVYLPSSSLLRGKLAPRPDLERLQRVLRATNAPGVRTLVAVVPQGGAYAIEVDAIQRFGTPYVIVEAPPLLEEIGAELAADTVRALWLPERGATPATSAQAVAREVMAASFTKWQGRVVPTACELYGPAELAREAARLVGVELRVRSTWTWLYRLFAIARSWLGSRVPAAQALAECLFPELVPGSKRKALPAHDGDLAAPAA
ncbi:hypothetical protein ACFL5O_03775 [Myxococcota bacterium]